jgi:hypothetical protein
VGREPRSQQRIGTTDTAELEAMFESREAITKTERQQELEESVTPPSGWTIMGGNRPLKTSGTA